LETSSSLLLQLGKEVAELVMTAQNNSDAAALRAANAIHNGRLLLLLITALSLMGAVLIAMRYVVPQVVRPIERITGAMSGLAAGDTSIEVFNQSAHSKRVTPGRVGYERFGLR